MMAEPVAKNKERETKRKTRLTPAGRTSRSPFSIATRIHRSSPSPGGVLTSKKPERLSIEAGK